MDDLGVPPCMETSIFKPLFPLQTMPRGAASGRQTACPAPADCEASPTERLRNSPWSWAIDTGKSGKEGP